MDSPVDPGSVPGSVLSDRVRRGDYYFLDLEPGPGRLVVVCGGREVCDDSYVVDRPGFRYHSLEFVASGVGSLRLGGRTYPLHPGTVFSYGPGIPHRIEVAPGSSMVKYFVDFVGDQAAALVQGAYPEGHPWEVNAAAWIQRLFEDLKAAADGLGDPKAVCALIVEQLLVLLADRNLSGPPEDAPLGRRFRALRAQLKELALESRSLDQVAAACGVSTSYLGRLFRRFDTVTPHQYLVQCRMAFAASLLLDRHLLVKEVALLSGYEDQYHFSRKFKEVYGCSPEAFRHLRA